MYWKCITKNVLVSLMRCWPSLFFTIPEQSWPISLAKDRSHFFAYCGWRRSCAHVMYSPVSLLRTRHAVACCASMCAASAVVCKRVRDAIWFVAACAGLAFLALVLCATGYFTCRRSRRAPLVIVPCGAPLVIVSGWALLEVTVGACRSCLGCVFDWWLLYCVPCVFGCNCSMLDWRGGIYFCCGVLRHVLKIFLSSWTSSSCENLFQPKTGCSLSFSGM